MESNNNEEEHQHESIEKGITFLLEVSKSVNLALSLLRTSNSYRVSSSKKTQTILELKAKITELEAIVAANNEAMHRINKVVCYQCGGRGTLLNGNEISGYRENKCKHCQGIGHIEK